MSRAEQWTSEAMSDAYKAWCKAMGWGLRPSSHGWSDNQLKHFAAFYADAQSAALRAENQRLQQVLPRIDDAVDGLNDPSYWGIVDAKKLEWMPMAQGHVKRIIADLRALLRAEKGESNE